MENFNTLNAPIDRTDPNLSGTFDSPGLGLQTSPSIMASVDPLFEEGLDGFNLLPPYELFGDNNCLNSPSIFSDCAKVQSDNANWFDSCDSGNGSRKEQKPEIRNSDAMWSSNGSSMLRTSESSTVSENAAIANAVPFAVVTGNTQNIINNTSRTQQMQMQQQQQQQQPTTVVANNKNCQAQRHITVKQEIKTESIDDHELQLQMHIIRKIIEQQESSTDNVAPGRSLLRKNSLLFQLQELQELQEMQQMKSVAGGNSSLAAHQRNLVFTIVNATNMAKVNAELRHNTPLSINNDAAEFKHNVDLAACVMGSNNISLNDTDANIMIQQYKQELQDTSRPEINSRLVQRGNSLSEVLDVIHNDSNIFTKSSSSSVRLSSSPPSPSPSPSSTEKIKLLSSTHLGTSECLSDEDEDDVASSCSSGISYGSVALSSQTSTTSGISSGSSMNGGHHHDHSYTRCKEGMEEMCPSLETPSDSDEEIDVVSLGDKKLPTNPSDKDRLKFQTKVAHKLSHEHIVKTPNGIRTIPPQRRASCISNVAYILPYTPAGSSSSTPKPGCKYARGPPPLIKNTDSTTAAAFSKIKSMSSDKRKRLTNSANNEMPPSKKIRGKKATATATQVSGIVAIATTSDKGPNCSHALKRNKSLDEIAAEAVEKRNLHNDMERQRRVGLKNRFDELKDEIPILKDKPRAAKVHILKEGAAESHALVEELDMASTERAFLIEELRKNQEMLEELERELEQEM